MTTVHELRSSDDPRDVVHQVVADVARGGVAVVPTLSEYLVVGAADRPEAVERIVSAGSNPRLLLRSSAAVWDYVPGAPSRVRRFVDRVLPRPVIFEWPAATTGDGALAALGESVVEGITGEGVVGIRVADHPFVAGLLELLPTPLVAASVGDGSCPEPDACPAAETIVDDGPLGESGAPTIVRFEDGGDWQATSGSLSEDELRRLDAVLVLFVCTGNTCRSPMAAAVFRRMLAERLECEVEALPRAGFVVESAGLSAAYGGPASVEAVRLLAGRGMDLEPHRSQPLTDDLLDTADVVWTMTRSHREAIVTVRPDAASRVATLAADGDDVSDPFGGGPDEYAECLEQIESLLHPRLDELMSGSASADAGR